MPSRLTRSPIGLVWGKAKLKTFPVCESAGTKKNLKNNDLFKFLVTLAMACKVGWLFSICRINETTSNHLILCVAASFRYDRQTLETKNNETMINTMHGKDD